MISRLLLLLPLLFCLGVSAQDTLPMDSGYTLPDVVISGIVPNTSKYSSLNIEGVSIARMQESNPYNLSDALAKVPGVSQMSTGNSISKPVIRGLYGNRILVLLSGLRFDNQQWQDEHGLGLSQIGISWVEIIKGPASLLYGSEAIGGVINIIEEKPFENGTKADAGLTLFANTRGALTDAGVSQKNNNHWWRLRLGAENHADYSDGANNRVLNSRNKGYYIKAGIGFEKKRWVQENNYNFSYNQYGFILDDLSSFFKADNRWNRAMAGPHHNVQLHLFNSQNTFLLPRSILKLNAGIQSNSRMEDEGGGEISLSMHLFSVLQNLKWEKSIGKKTTLIINQQYSYSSNKNLGKRILIPNAQMMEGNVSGFIKWYATSKWILETGAGITTKYIHTLPTKTLNAPGQPVQPFTKNKPAANVMAGLAYNPTQKLTLKGNFATGYRTPNLAELSSNGLHEGVYRYELGDPNLLNEQNLMGDLSFAYLSGQWQVNTSVYYNHFYNYIYLAPTTESFFGFPVFHFKQQNASLYGGEFFAVFSPKKIKWLKWKETFVLTKGILDKGGNLPFIPAYKINTALRAEKSLKNGDVKFIEAEWMYVFAQNNPAQFETKTPAYQLLNITGGITLLAPTGNWRLGITLSNITNTVYADHLSRLKYYGLNNQGVNIVFSVRKMFAW